jgi:tRNA pseudouridine38-40 synthase
MFPYRLIISYDGTRYFGWQKTDAGPSIQGTLEKAIISLGEISPCPEAASRTDRGVHAEGQAVLIVLQKRWEEKKLRHALNGSLPSDLRVLLVEAVPLEFHPTLDALEKEYLYDCCLRSTQDPIYRLYSWHLHRHLLLEEMREGAKQLLGTHDFSAFTNTHKENPICTLRKIEIFELAEDRLQISLTGDRFLYKMARNLIGTLIAVGSRKISLDELKTILASKDRKQAGMTAPAHGLSLHRIVYRSFAKNSLAAIES